MGEWPHFCQEYTGFQDRTADSVTAEPAKELARAGKDVAVPVAVASGHELSQGDLDCLHTVVVAWPTLPVTVRSEILQMVAGAIPRPDKK